MRLSSESLIELHAGAYAASVAPAAGGRVASLRWRSGGSECPLLVELSARSFDEHDWPKAGAFPMLPFANRLPRDGFSFGGRIVRPQPGPAGFALHGFAHRRPWIVTHSTAGRLVMRYRHEGKDCGWPWIWSAEQRVELAEDGMTVTIGVTNESAEPMPLTMGWHPYHPVSGAIVAEDLQFESAARRNLDGEGTAEDLDRQPTFGMRSGETAAFTEWAGRLRLRTHSGTIVVSCLGAAHLVLHRPSSGDYVCAEPVSGLPGHLGKSVGSASLDELQPDETRWLRWSCGFEPATLKGS